MSKINMNIINELLQLDAITKNELLSQKEYTESLNEANIKRISDLLDMTMIANSKVRELIELNSNLKQKIKTKKRKHKNKLQKMELNYIRQIHLLKSELYDKIIQQNSGSEELRKIIEIYPYVKKA